MIWEIDEKTEAIEGIDAQGRADPAYAAALGLLPAPFGRRALAVVVDVVLGMLLALPFVLGALPLLVKFWSGSISAYGLVNHPGFVLAVVCAAVSTLLCLVYLVVQLILHGMKGLTIGKALTGMRTVQVRTLARPGVGRVLARGVVVGASGIIPVLGPAFLLVSPTFDPEHRGRGLHDAVAGVWLVDVRRGLNPYDEKRMRVARKMVKAEPAPARSALPSLATSADPGAEPAYRPGSRVSAGILGLARPHSSRERPVVGLSLATPAVAPAPTAPGTPVLGGYRMPAAGLASSPPTVPPPPTAAPATAAPPPVAPSPVPEPAPAVSFPKPEPSPAPEAAPTAFGLRFDTGELVSVAEPVLIGRNPDAAEHPGARTVALTDDSRTLSKTHLLVRPLPDGLEITDWHSTNGSRLGRGGTEQIVAAATPVVTADGDIVRLGDRAATVVRVSPARDEPR